MAIVSHKLSDNIAIILAYQENTMFYHQTWAQLTTLFGLVLITTRVRPIIAQIIVFNVKIVNIALLL